MTRLKRLSRHFVLPGLLALPLILLTSSLLTFREFNRIKDLYLRNRAAAIAARLETLSTEQLRGDSLELLALEEPSLADLEVFSQEDRPAREPAVRAILAGRELFRTEEITVDGENLFRAYLPFHSGSQLHAARIDLDASAADFLLIHARHNLVVVAISGLALVLLSFFLVWSMRRAAWLERKQLELEHFARLGKLSAMLAHEIRNPLGTIKGFAQLARERATPAVSSLLEPAIDEIGRLEKLVNHLLLYGRPQDPSIQAFDWRRIADQIEAHAREAIGERPICFVRHDSPVELQADPDLLQQVLLNLVRNSIEALGDSPEGEVVLSAYLDGHGDFRVTVEDNGPGLPESVRKKLYEPFVTTKAFGAGLGLAITRKLVTTLGGKMEFRDAKPRGTRAELIFPGVVSRTLNGESRSEWKQSS